MALSGCAGVDGATAPAEPEGLRWVSEAKARASGLPAWSLTMPLGARRDGTALVREFLEYVESKGGRYLTEVDLVLAVQGQGRPVECRTRVSLAPGRAPATSATLDGSPETRSWRKAETRQVTELETRCEMVSTTVTVPESYTEHSYDPSSRSTRSRTSSRMVTRTEWHEECRPEMVDKHVTRFVYQFHAGFIPPDLEQVAYDVRAPELAESAPECTVLPPGAGARPEPVHRFEARILGCRDVSLPPEVNKPEAEMSRAERLRHEYRLKALAAGKRDCDPPAP